MTRDDTEQQDTEGSRAPDRLTRVLVVLAVLLCIVVAVMAGDVWSNRRAVELADGSPGEQEVQPQPTLTPAGEPAAGVTTQVAPTPPACIPPNDWVTHVVQEGDTLFSLADRFGTDVETIQYVNCLKNDIIVLDKELFVPGPPAASIIAVTADASGRPLEPENVQVQIPEGYLNIVLLGSDKREEDGAWRTDTMIVVSLDTGRNIVRLLSIPRDLWVNISGHGYDRINTADLWGELEEEGGGPEKVKEVIYQVLGIPIHYYVRVDFDGFIEIIDAVGGVEIDVECPLSDIELEPGIHYMDGEDALLYARSRITTNDFDRARRQRKILMALWQQRLNKGLIPRLPALWRALSGTIETDMPFDQVLGLAYMGLQLNPNQIFSQSIGPWQVENWITPEGAEVLLPRADKIQELLNGFYGPVNTEFLERMAATRIEVLNGSWRTDLAQLAAASLRWFGMEIVGVGMADSQDYAETQIIVYNSDTDVAELITQELNLMPTAIRYQPGQSSSVDILVILGADYDPCAAN